MATDQLPQPILDARRKYVEAGEEADRLEREARRARRRANSRLSHYETLLREYQGQERLPFEEAT